MRHFTFVLECTLLIIAGSASAQAQDPAAWTGVWQGLLDGQPSVTLTLAEDSGELAGTVVLNIISREGGQPHVIGLEPHVLVRPHVENNKLSFELRRIDKSSEPMNFTVVRSSDDKARIHCLNCGVEAPIVDLVRAH